MVGFRNYIMLTLKENLNATSPLKFSMQISAYKLAKVTTVQ